MVSPWSCKFQSNNRTVLSYVVLPLDVNLVQTCCKLSILQACCNMSTGCNKSAKIRLVVTCNLQTCLKHASFVHGNLYYLGI